MCRAGTTHWFYTHTHWGYESGRVMVGLDKDKTLSYCNTIEAERNTVSLAGTGDSLAPSGSCKQGRRLQMVRAGGGGLSGVKAGRQSDQQAVGWL